MKHVLFAVLAVGLITGCAWFKSAPVQAVLQPVEAVGCSVETAITGDFGAEVVAECQGTDPAACGQAFQTALGNVNLCNLSLPQPANALAASAPKWGKVGDVTDGDLKAGKGAVKAQAVKAQGIVGAVACPVAINTALGLLTGVIPQACGCKNNLSASQVGQALNLACQAAVPI